MLIFLISNLFGFVMDFFFNLLYQNSERKNLTCNGRGYSDMQMCVFHLFHERKKKIKAHQWSLNLLSWCLSH